jgi:hypothetical protein
MSDHGEGWHDDLPHGLTATPPDLVYRDLLMFCQESKRKVA